MEEDKDTATEVAQLRAKLKTVAQEYNKLKSNNEKLAQELEKSRVHSAVLKKAVLQEKEKMVELQDSLLDKDKQLRLFAEENDVLSFNNKRLTKRVEMLMQLVDEARGIPTTAQNASLDHSLPPHSHTANSTQNSTTHQNSTTSSSWWWWGGGGAGSGGEASSASDHVTVLEAELERRIKENEQLHLKLSDTTRTAEENVSQLTLSLNSVREKLALESSTATKNISQLSTRLQECETLRDELKQKCETLQTELANTSETMSAEISELRQQNTVATNQLAVVTHTFRSKVLFDDTCNPSFHALNLPPHQLERANKLSSLIQSIERVCGAVSDVFGGYYTSLRQRSLLVKQDPSASTQLKEASDLLCDTLSKYAPQFAIVVDNLLFLLRALQDSSPSGFETVKECASALERGATAWFAFHDKLLTHYISSMRAELLLPSLTETAKTHHKELVTGLEVFQTSLTQLQLAVCPLVTFVYRGHEVMQRKNLHTAREELLSSLRATRDALQTVSHATENVISLEISQSFVLPTLKAADERLLSGMSKVLALVDQLVSLCDSWCEVTRPVVCFAKGGPILPESVCCDTAAIALQVRRHMETANSTILELVAREQAKIEDSLQLPHLQAQVQQLQAKCDALLEEKLRISLEAEKVRDLQSRLTAAHAKIRTLTKSAQSTPPAKPSTQETTATCDPNATADATSAENPTQAQGQEDESNDNGNNTGESHGAVQLNENQPPETAAETDTNVRGGEHNDNAGEEDADDFEENVDGGGEIGASVNEFEVIRLREREKELEERLLVAQREAATLSENVQRMEQRLNSLQQDRTNHGSVSSESHSTDAQVLSSSKTFSHRLRLFRVPTNTPSADVLRGIDGETVPVNESEGSGQTTNEDTDFERGLLLLPPEIQAREWQIIRFYKDRLAAMAEKVSAADRRALVLESECEKATESAESLERLNRKLKRLAKDAKAAEKQYQDDLLLSCSNYDTQIKALTEHTIDLQERESATQLEIASLKSHKVKCGRCKQWNSVEWLIERGMNGMQCSGGNHPSSYNYA